MVALEKKSTISSLSPKKLEEGGSSLIEELSMIILSKSGAGQLGEEYKETLSKKYGEKMGNLIEKYYQRISELEEEKEELQNILAERNKKQYRVLELTKFFLNSLDQILEVLF
jgi:hypothetical protein